MGKWRNRPDGRLIALINYVTQIGLVFVLWIMMAIVIATFIIKWNITELNRREEMRCFIVAIRMPSFLQCRFLEQIEAKAEDYQQSQMVGDDFYVWPVFPHLPNFHSRIFYLPIGWCEKNITKKEGKNNYKSKQKKIYSKTEHFYEKERNCR